MRCSILAASKMQVYPTVSGTTSQFYGCGLSISQFLRGSPSLKIDHFFKNLKHFMDYVELPKEVQNSLQGMINHFAFIVTMFTKYEEILSKVVTIIPGKNEEFENIKTLGWIIFILGRVNILHKRNEIVESACLLIAVLTFVLGHFKNAAKPDAIQETRKMLCGVFKMKTTDPAQAMEESLLRMFCQIEGREINPDELFDTDKIGLNLKKMSSQYQQKLGIDEIDERIFVISEMRITTPLKFTPFARQGGANRIVTPAKPEDVTVTRKLKSSKRVLTYDTPAVATKENVTLSTKLNEIKFSQYSLQSPYTVSKLPTATPITRAMEMNNWLQDHISKANTMIENTGLSHFAITLLTNAGMESALKCLNGVIDNLVKKISAGLGIDKDIENTGINQPKTHIKINEIKATYYRMVDEMLSIEDKKIGALKAAQIMACLEFHKSALAAATEVVLFVHNSMAIRFEQILEICEVQAFDFWKLIRAFLKFDPVMPGPLRMHFQQIEIKIITSLAWQKNSSLHMLISKIVEKEKQEEKKSAIRIESSFCLEKEDTGSAKATPMRDVNPPLEAKESPKIPLTIDNATLQLYLQTGSHFGDISIAHEFFFQRVLHIVSSKILSMSEALGINDEPTKEKLWEVMKHCLSSETDLMIDRHIDQLLLCTLYAVGKMAGAKFTFNNIISKYIDLHSSFGDTVTSLFFHVKIDDRKTEDIIGFYNHVFIPRVKSAICGICQQNNGSSSTRLPPHPMNATVIGTQHLPNSLAPPKLKIRALAPESPLNANLPPAQLQYQLGSFSKTFIGGLGCGNANFKIGSPLPMMTPRTKALYAFGESPAPGIKNLTPSVVSERKGNYKDNLRSQILLPQTNSAQHASHIKSGLPPMGDSSIFYKKNHV